MLRSFLSRLVGSAPRSLLLPPSLAICLACATPFPIDDLEEGMTTETARENFGAPEAITPWPRGARYQACAAPLDSPEGLGGNLGGDGGMRI